MAGEKQDFVAPDPTLLGPTLLGPTSPQRLQDLREVFNALRWIVWAG